MAYGTRDLFGPDPPPQDSDISAPSDRKMSPTSSHVPVMELEQRATVMARAQERLSRRVVHEPAATGSMGSACALHTGQSPSATGLGLSTELEPRTGCNGDTPQPLTGVGLAASSSNPIHHWSRPVYHENRTPSWRRYSRHGCKTIHHGGIRGTSRNIFFWRYAYCTSEKKKI